MSIDELVDKYLHKIGRKRTHGSGIEPILPFFMLDAMYSIFNKDIRKVDCRHKLKQVRREWIQAYCSFNKEFFSAFNDDETCEILDLMDNFYSYIENDLVLVKSSILQLLPSEIDFESRKVIASSHVCNVLIQSSQVIWRNVFFDNKMKPCTNKSIYKMERNSDLWSSIYYSQFGCQSINLNNSKALTDNINQLCHRMVNWMAIIKKEALS